ncbi:hypothetical protein BJX64DRAFT_249038 [Aspergillus heterothallicus]
MPAENLVSCHEFLEHEADLGVPPTPAVGISQPSMVSYKRMLDRFQEGDHKWFAAAHMWDVSAAVKAGSVGPHPPEIWELGSFQSRSFRGAYCSIYENESCIEIFDTELDVMADTLPEMADKIIDMTS